MSTIPGDLKYANSHEWVRDNGDGTASVGISDHAQAQLGDLVYVELPETGQTVSAGDACAVVESVKAASDIYAPVSGEVVEVNETLADAPELVNQSAYGDGWLFKVKVDGDNASALLDADAYKALIESETDD